MTRAALALLVLSFVNLAGLAASAVASAQDTSSIDEARTAFENGRVAYEDGRFEEALTAFQRAYELTSSADILYNIGTVADRLRRDRLALESYRGYLRARPDSADRAQIEARVEVLQGQVVADDEAARAADERAARETRLRAELDRQRESGGNPSDAVPPPPVTYQDPSPAPWVVLGVGGAALATGVVLVVLAAMDSACVTAPAACVEEDTAPRWEEVADAYNRIPVFQGVGGALIGVGAAAVAVGLVWGLSQGGGAQTASLRVGPGSVSVEGSF